MARYEEPFEDHEQLFSDFIEQIPSLRNINVKILSCNKLKEVCKVTKASDILEHMTQQQVVILINETIFEQLEDAQKQMVVEENVAKIYVDEETDKLKLIQPDVHTFSLLLTKYGYPDYERLNVTIKTLFAQAAEEAAQTT